MEILSTALIMLMLLLIISGTVAFCVMVYRKARRAASFAEVALDAVTRHDTRLDEMDERITDLREKVAQSASESATDKANRQFADMQDFQLKNYGLNFGGANED